MRYSKLTGQPDVCTAGDRMPLSPGYVRNVLIPRKQALLVIKGRIASPLRDMMMRESKTKAYRLIDLANLAKASAIIAAAKKVEEKAVVGSLDLQTLSCVSY